MAEEKCKAVTISGSASAGKDPTPLYEAGKDNISCVIGIEALAQIQISKAVFEQKVLKDTDASFGGIKIEKPIYKYSITAQSGQAYYVSTMSAFGTSK